MVINKTADRGPVLIATSVIAPISPGQTQKHADDIASKGLTSDEAHARLEKDGPNALPDPSAHPLRNALAKSRRESHLSTLTSVNNI